MSDTFPSLRAQIPVFLHAKLFCARCVYVCVYICPIVLLLYVSQPPPLRPRWCRQTETAAFD